MRIGLAGCCCESDAPPDEPSDGKDPLESPPHLDHFGGHAAGNFRGNPQCKRQRDREQPELREHALRGLAGGFPQSEKIAPVGLILTMPPPALLVLWLTRRSVAKAVRDSVLDWPPRREGPKPDAAAESPLRPDVRVTPSISLGRGSPGRPPFSGAGAEPAGRR